MIVMSSSWLFTAIAACIAIFVETSSAQSSPALVLQGRFSPGYGQGNATLPQTFSWAASSIYASFKGTDTVRIDINSLPPNGSVTYGINWFRFFVDGQFAADGFTSYHQLNMSMTLNVTAAPHTLRVAKMNDGSKGEAVLQNITIGSNGTFLHPVAPAVTASGRKILFLGDSYSVGYGNAGAVLPNTCKPAPSQLQQDWSETCTALKVTDSYECASLWQVFNQNGLAAFPAVAAEALHADYQVIATSGSGMVGYSFAALQYPSLSPAEYEAILPSNEALFNRSVYANSSSQYNLSSWMPEVVVVSSGTNDWHSLPPMYDLEEWVAQAVAFLREISKAFNEPIIIIQAWPANQQLAGVLDGDDGVNETVQYLLAMPSLATAATQEGIPNIHYLQLTTNDYDNYHDWCGGHPSAVADRVIAEQLVSFIGVVHQNWTTDTPINTTVDQVAIRPNTSLYSAPAKPPPAAASAGR